MEKCLNLEYDVVLSFAGEDRKYVEKTASYLRKNGAKVFYDSYEDVNLWGKDLYQHLDDVYQNKAKYAIIFISEHYEKKLWTNHELKSAQARAFSENEEYILPVRFDSTEIPGIRKTIGYVSAKENTPLQLGKKIIKKLGYLEPENFLPEKLPFINRIFQTIYEDFTEQEIHEHVYFIFDRLKKMNQNERKFLVQLILNTCTGNLFEDFHERTSLLTRVTGFSRTEIIEIVTNLSNIGFEYSITKKLHGCFIDGVEVEEEFVYLRFTAFARSILFENLTFMLFCMYQASLLNRCDICQISTLERLDFTDLQLKIEDEELERILDCIPSSFYDNDEAVD